MVVEAYLEARARLAGVVGNLVSLARETDESPETVETLQTLSRSLADPLLFVVVGEVKAGKSSLLNAVFGQEFCKVDVLPATDKIYVFKYGETEHDVAVSEHLTERYRPIPFLKNFNIVDTPGTNTIVASHHEITTSYVPLADLIVFVFSVANPWAASAWEFLRLLGNRWKKNIVFVLQQADLRSPEEVEIIIKHLDQTILQILGSSRPIFAVAAKKALQAKLKSNPPEEKLWQESNFAALEKWISETVTQSEQRGGKLRSTAQTAQVVANAIQVRLQSSVDLLKSDQEKLGTIRRSLEARKGQTLRQVGGFIREMEMAYDNCRERGEKLLEERLTLMQTFKMIFSGGRWEKDFQDQVERDVRTKVQEQIEHALGLLESDLRGIWHDLQERVQVQFDAKRQVRAAAALPGFLSQRGIILQKLQLTLLEQTSDAKIKEQLQSWFGETARWLRVPAGVAAAGGVFTIIAALAHAAILDVTGTVAGLAAAAGTVYAVLRRRHILREYRRRMNEKRAQLSEAVETQLRNAITAFYHEVGATFDPLESFCLAEAHRIMPLRERVDEIERSLVELKLGMDR
ncbi:MAG: dynamin family protein [Verrucomicrobia bacterium]|nr:dynamin family protein [Verrucomicrobiota bacterium]MBV8485044.1 dynamin family protein [Verrucomicrobiota bacterium]